MTATVSEETITHTLTPDQDRWDIHAGQWIYHSPSGHRAVLNYHDNSWFASTDFPSLPKDAELVPDLSLSQLAVEGVIALHEGIHRGRILHWRPRTDLEIFDGAVGVDEYDGPFEFLARVAVFPDGSTTLTVLGRRESICIDEPVDDLPTGRQEALAAIETHIGSVTQLDTYTSVIV
ncbi:hypothetical protein [Nocardia suismassiliense]|uniref:hypothetical protein n=1 Tax=Nocardia suismassiliense TaxID=2077092 RepID=UPI000D1F2119|nr:hypothetical protein [Nocardia suismassiliense]